MTNDARDIEVMGQRMLGVAEARYGEPRMPVILSTPLEPAGKKIVRAHISTNAEIKKLLREATRLSTRSVFEMVDSDPVCKKLMELHRCRRTRSVIHPTCQKGAYVLDHGTYDKITPEAWARFDRDMAERQAKVRYAASSRH